jgi:hypothetical protein
MRLARAHPGQADRVLYRCLLLILLGLAASGSGCASIRVTDPPRTATEQFLLSGAASRAVEQLTFDSLRGRNVYVDSTYFAASEQAFVLGELRAKMLLGGIQIVPEPEEAQIIVEVRSGGVGIDREDFLIGTPAVILTSDTDGGVGIPFAVPEIALLKNIQQMGVASVAYVAYWADTGEVVATSGPFIGRTLRDDWWIFGFGPQTVGNIPTVEPD